MTARRISDSGSTANMTTSGASSRHRPPGRGETSAPKNDTHRLHTRLVDDLIVTDRRRGLPRHIEGKIEAVQDMIRLVMVSDDYPDEWS